MTFRLKPIAAALAAGIALGFAQGSPAQIILPPTHPITFDPDGPGGVSEIAISTFDWNPSSLLSLSGPCPSDSTGAVIPGCNVSQPVTDLVNPTYLKSITHAVLIGGQDPAGNAMTLPGLNSDYEITFVSGACIRAQPSGVAPFPGADVAETLLFTLNSSSACIVGGKDPLHPTLDASGQFFEIWYDNIKDGTGTKSDALSGTGFRDGKLILSGRITELDGQNTVVYDPILLQAGVKVPIQEPLDQYPPTDDWAPVTTFRQNGSVTTAAMVTALDKGFFKSGLDVDSFLKFTGEIKVAFQSTNPSRNFYLGTQPNPPVQVGQMAVLPPDKPSDIGPTNLGPDTELQADASQSFVPIDRPSACRVTGGGNDTSGIIATLDGSRPTGYDGTKSNDKLTPTKLLKYRGKKTTAVTDYYYYTFGGQAGANTALQPQPKGQWEHNNHSSPTGLQFAFHGGKNAPDGTQIDEIRCTDPGWCVQARPAPDKQIDFTGIGTFSNIKGNTAFGDGVVFDGIQSVIAEPQTGQPGQPVPTYHWFQVHIEDLGEPGSQQGLSDLDNSTKCPKKGSGNDPFASPPVTDKLADCDCRDFYRLTIYKGVVPALDADGKVILTSDGNIPGIDKTNKIYEVYGYIEGGNFQIHPLTGFDLQP